MVGEQICGNDPAGVTVDVVGHCNDIRSGCICCCRRGASCRRPRLRAPAPLGRLDCHCNPALADCDGRHCRAYLSHCADAAPACGRSGADRMRDRDHPGAVIVINGLGIYCGGYGGASFCLFNRLLTGCHVLLLKRRPAGLSLVTGTHDGCGTTGPGRTPPKRVTSRYLVRHRETRATAARQRRDRGRRRQRPADRAASCPWCP